MRQPLTNSIIQSGIVNADPISLNHKGEESVFFSFKSQHRCLNEQDWNDTYITSHLVMAFGTQVRLYASKVARGNRIKVTGYLAYQDLDSSSQKSPLIIAQRIVFLKKND